MASSTAIVATVNASRYLQQLCKHWSHTFDVVFDAHHGTIPLPIGTATLKATTVVLEVIVETADLTNLQRLQTVVAEHLDRFAFREAPLPFEWSPAGSPQD